MNILKQWQLHSGYTLCLIDKLPGELYLKQINEHLIDVYPSVPWRDYLDEKAKAKHEKIRERVRSRFRITLALIHKEQLVGWSYGWQDSVHVGDFYIAGSLVLPEHRRQNLYSLMVKKMIELTREEGFSSLRSRHHATNNPVLIAKLKLGFFINGFELDETMGSLVRMIYITTMRLEIKQHILEREKSKTNPS